MENAEEVMHSLEEFSKLKPKDIPRELDDYLGYVAKTGDPVFKWSIIKCLFREKLLNVITDFYESTLTIELPPCPNVDTFNYERMKANLLERLDSFHGAPFTVQRISELLTNPRKEYNRADKFMRAIEKNILVVSIREPGTYNEIDGDNQPDASFNGIPESNDSSLETTFTCNDLADPDSSSHVYEVINSDNNESSYTVNVDNSVVSEIQISVEADNIKEDGSGTSSDDSQEENIIEINSVQEKSELISSNEKEEGESVICSTNQINEEEKQNESTNISNDLIVNCENVAVMNEENSNSSNCSSEFEKDNCTGSSTNDIVDTTDSIKPSDEVESSDRLNSFSEVTNNEEAESDTNVISSVEDEDDEEEESVITSKTNESETKDNLEECTPVLLPTEDAPLVFNSRTIECDTSSFDIENNSEQGPEEEVEEEPQLQEEEKKSNTINVESTTTSDDCIAEENEVTSCVEENLDDNKDDNVRETSVIHTTSTPDFTESMEVEQCEVTDADQSS